jgi:inorganic pyrophosphatase
MQLETPAMKRNFGDFLHIPAFADGGGIHVVVETPRGSPVKLKYEPALGAFQLGRVLVPGTVYPHDWGFVPETVAADGDPLDVLILGVAGCFPGLVLRARPIGVLQVEQREGRKRFRNDRLLVLPWETAGEMPFRDVRELRHGEKEDIERFFSHSVEHTGKHLSFIGWRGPKAAESEVKRCRARFKASAKAMPG